MMVEIIDGNGMIPIQTVEKQSFKQNFKKLGPRHTLPGINLFFNLSVKQMSSF